MPDVTLDTETHDRLLTASRLMGEPVGDVIKRLVDRLIKEPDTAIANSTATLDDVSEASVSASAGGVADGGWLNVHKIYKSHRIEGRFNPASREVQLLTDPWTNRFFASPTAAAVAVVEHYSSDVRETNNTNGRKFWKVTATGANLRSVIGERMS